MDCDGRISPNEMQYFYEEQLHRMECMAQEPVLFDDICCQMADMINPQVGGGHKNWGARLKEEGRRVLDADSCLAGRSVDTGSQWGELEVTGLVRVGLVEGDVCGGSRTMVDAVGKGRHSTVSPN